MARSRGNPLRGVKYSLGILIDVDDAQLQKQYPLRSNAKENRISEAVIAKLLGGRLGGGQRLEPDVLDIKASVGKAIAQQLVRYGKGFEGRILAEFLKGIEELEIKQTSAGATTKLFELQLLDSQGRLSDNPLAEKIASGRISDSDLREGFTKKQYSTAKINDRIKMITSQGWLRMLDSNSTLRSEATRKLRNLFIIQERDDGRRLSLYGLKEFRYNTSYMKADVRYDKKGSIKIRYLLKDNVEQAIIKKIEDSVIGANNLRLNNLKFSELRSIATETLRFTWPSGGSIPFMQLGLKYGMLAADKGSGSAPKVPALPKRTARATQFISKEVLSALVRARVSRDMPHGPVGGPPLSDTKLTYRTGRFVNSIKIDFMDFKRRLITYFYNPIYGVHEQTGRDPRRLLERNIKLELQQRFSQQFRILKSHAFV